MSGDAIDQKPVDRFGVLIARVSGFLADYGVEDGNGVGDGDFAICLDNYNDRDFFVLVANISIIHPDWISGLQAILRTTDGNWVIHIVLGILAQHDRAAINGPGIEISSHTVKEHWDRALLASRFGSHFHFEANTSA